MLKINTWVKKRIWLNGRACRFYKVYGRILGKVRDFFYLCHVIILNNMDRSVIFRFLVLGVLWLGLVGYILTHTHFTLYTAFVIVASAIIIFVPMYKKYVRK